MQVTYRPIGKDWPGDRTPWSTRKRSPFVTKSTQTASGWKPGGPVSWSDTLLLLDREVRWLGVEAMVFQIDIDERDIRMDGLPKSNARVNDPAVIISFDSQFGPLRYFCDRFDRYQDNIRAIALGLEALRKVDRYGITKRGEQYTGWKALPSPDLSRRAAADVIVAHLDGNYSADEVLTDPRKRSVAITLALRASHPDTGKGRPGDLQKVLDALKILEAIGG